DDPLVAELGQQEYVRRVAVHDPRAGDAEPTEAVHAERGDDRGAEWRDDLGEPRVLRRRLDARGAVEGHRVARRVEALEQAAGLTREVLPRGRGVAFREGAQECRGRELRRVLELHP